MANRIKPEKHEICKIRPKWLTYMLCLVLFAGAVAGCIFWLVGKPSSALEASIVCRIIPQQATVEARVAQIRCQIGMSVNRGDTLILLQDSAYRVAVRKALSEFEAGIEVKRLADEAVYEQTSLFELHRQRTDSIRTVLEEKEQTYYRYEELFQKQQVSYEMFVTAQQEMESVRAVFQRSEVLLKETEVCLADLLSRQRIAESRYETFKAALELAELELSQCAVLATDSGIVERISVSSDTFVTRGQELVGIVPKDGKWVVARFSEELADKINSDAIFLIRAHLDSIDYEWEGRMAMTDYPDDETFGHTGTVFCFSLPDLPEPIFTRLSDGFEVEVVLQ